MTGKILWNTVKIVVPSDFITVTDKGVIKIRPPLTKTNKIATSKKKPAIDIQTGDVDEVKITEGGEYQSYTPKPNKELVKQHKTKRKEKEDNENDEMGKEDVNRAESMHEKMARLRSMRKSHKKKVELKEIPENYNELMESAKNFKKVKIKNNDGRLKKLKNNIYELAYGDLKEDFKGSLDLDEIQYLQNRYKDVLPKTNVLLLVFIIP